MAMPNFTHLHVHSHFSLLDGLPQIDSLVDHAKKLGFTSLALTDHGFLYGAVEYYKKAKAADIKPIIGLEAYLAIDSIADKRGKIDNDYYHLILLAQDLEGYKNLMKLTTIAALDGFYYRPRIDKELLTKFGKHIIALSGCMRGDIPRALLAGEFERAKNLVASYKEIFNDKFYLEIQRHNSSDNDYALKETQLNERLIKLSRETNTPLVATQDSHYLEPEDSVAQDLMVCVGIGKTVNDPDRLDMRSVDLSLKSQVEMQKLFADLPSAIENTEKIADLCNLEIPLGERHFPDFQVPEGYDPNTYLKVLAYEGIAKKYNIESTDKEDLKQKIEPSIIQRLDYELEVIIKKNYSAYFLVVSDFVNWARMRNIITTTRGSAAGSLVSYAIGITNVNPLNYQLPFERFLNPMRPTPPDIDMDFADNRRDEVIAYVTEKYGEDKVAQIVTFGTMMARAAVRDIGRALGIPYTKCDRVAKMIPIGKQGFHMTLKKALDISPELKDVYEKDPETKNLIDQAIKVEGAARHASVHAAGIVISPTPLTDYTPLQRDQGEKIITQYDMYSIEDAGLVKMDFLGIRNLSILGNTIEIVEHTKNIKVDLNNLPLDDKKTFQLLVAGKTMGLFQLGGSGMTRYLKELAPSSIFDIMAMVALYRPGPLESIPEYIKRKHNPQLISFSDPKLKEILSMSYGIITYQDDVLLIAINIAGYTWEEADKLRKAMGKKIPKVMAAEKEKFIQGCVTNSNYTQEKAIKLWQLIEPFAAYGFGKAHAASYGIVAYQTAYMKANFPVEFMAALMTAESGDMPTVAQAVEECKSMGIEVLSPDINESLANFTVIDDRHIRFGLTAIKNLGSDVIGNIIAQRKASGKFKNLEDFISRMQTKNFNKKSWEALVKSGAMDGFGERNMLLANTESILEAFRNFNKEASQNQTSLFGSAPQTIKLKFREVEPATNNDKLSWEKELLGLYVSAHPMDEYLETISKFSKPIAEQIKNAAGMIRVCGMVNKVQRILTKKGDQMAFVDIEDKSGSVEIVVFPTLYQKYNPLLVEQKILIIEGKITDKDGAPKILAEDIKEFNPNVVPTTVTIKIPENASDQMFLDLKKLLETYPGEMSVNLLVNEQRVKTPFRVNMTEELKQQIKRIIGN